MALKANQLWIVEIASEMADLICRTVMVWKLYDRETVGNQLIRSAGSVGANIVEGYGRYHPKDRLRFYFIARGSLEESMFWIRRACMAGLLKPSLSKHWLERYQLLSRGLDKFIQSQTPLNPA